MEVHEIFREEAEVVSREVNVVEGFRGATVEVSQRTAISPPVHTIVRIPLSLPTLGPQISVEALFSRVQSTFIVLRSGLLEILFYQILFCFK